MGKLTFHISISLDGYVAGPEQSLQDPLGKGGEALHEWVISLAAWRASHGYEGGEVDASTPLVERWTQDVGAVIMGRGMFGGGPGPWSDEPWNGWWGDEPPFHAPVFVLTHHAREPVTMQGGTTFTFVTDGVESAYAQAQAAAGEREITLGGGADVVQQFLRAGLVDEFHVSVVPVFLGGGARLFDGLAGAGITLESSEVVDAPGVTHLGYRVVR